MTRSKISVLALTLGVASAATALLAACGSSGSSASQTMANAANKTVAARTAAVTLSLTADSTPPVKFSGSGGTNFSSRQQHLTATLIGVPGIPDGSSAELILQVPLVYVHPLGAAATAVKTSLGIITPWLELDLRTLASIQGLDFGTISAAQAVEPTQYLNFLLGATSVSKVGTEQAGGVTTTHYTATLDLAQAIKKVSGNDAVTLNRDFASYASGLVPADIWLDGQGLLRKLSLTVTLKPVAGKPAVHDKISFDLTAFGTSVNTAAPPTGQTTNLSSILGSLAG